MSHLTSLVLSVSLLPHYSRLPSIYKYLPAQLNGFTFIYVWSEYVFAIWRCFSASMCIIWIVIIAFIWCMCLQSFHGNHYRKASLFCLYYEHSQRIDEIKLFGIFSVISYLSERLKLISILLCFLARWIQCKLNAFFALAYTKMYITRCIICSDM